MSNRVTEKELQAIVDRINTTCGLPLTPYAKKDDGQYTPCAGVYHLDYAYGGVALYKMADKGTGVLDVLRVGHVPKRELCGLLHAYLGGLEVTEEATPCQ